MADRGPVARSCGRLCAGAGLARGRAACPRGGEGSPPQARHARGAPGRHQGAGLPRRPAGRRRLVDHRRRAGVPGGHDGARGDGAAGPRQLADAGQVLAQRAGGRRVPGPVRHPHGAAHRPEPGQRHAHARARLRPDVPRVGLRDDHQGIAPPAGPRRDPQGGDAHQPGPERPRRLDLRPRGGRRGVGDGHPGAGPPRRAERGVPRPEGGDRGGRAATWRSAGPPRAASSTPSAPAAGRGSPSRRPPSPRSTTPASSTAPSRRTA